VKGLEPFWVLVPATPLPYRMITIPDSLNEGFNLAPRTFCLKGQRLRIEHSSPYESIAWINPKDHLLKAPGREFQHQFTSKRCLFTLDESSNLSRATKIAIILSHFDNKMYYTSINPRINIHLFNILKNREFHVLFLSVGFLCESVIANLNAKS